MRGIILGFSALLASAASPARAAWFEATTTHFVVDADAPEGRVKDFASRLERFDAALRMLYGVADDPSRKSNRVHVFATSRDMIAKVYPGPDGENIAGFYNPRAGGSVIFTTALSGGAVGDYDLSPQAVLLHEYSHHFMYSSFPIAYPFWYSEGFAEFNANVAFNDDGSIDVGLPARYRLYVMLGGITVDDRHVKDVVQSQVELPIEVLLDPPKSVFENVATHDLMYGRGWLLTNYLTLNPQRRPQLEAYLANMNKGMKSVPAAKAAFDDIRELGLELARYLRSNKMEAPFRVPPPKHSVPVDLRPLSAGETAMIPVHMRSTAGVTPAVAKGVAVDAERRAQPFPDDARVQEQLAEAEFDADNLDAADVAAGRALAVDPTSQRGWIYKGRVAIARAKKAKATDAPTWAAARAWFVKANRADPDAAEPMLLYYQSYLAQGGTAPEGALQALERAEVLAPEDSEVRWLLAKRLLADGNAPDARFLLQPIAFAPEDRGASPVFKQVVDLIDAGKLDEAKAKMASSEDGEEDKSKKKGGTAS
jgi:tetratricopeptide (TPR) repeat protein